MLKSLIALLLFSGFSTGLLANWPPVPVKVNVDEVTDSTFPAIYYFGDNYLRLISHREIFWLRVDGSNFTVTDKDSGLFIISRRRSYKDKPDGSPIRVTVFFSDYSSRSFDVRLVFIPPVKILFLDSAQRPLDVSTGTVKYSGPLSCKALWHLPPYVGNAGRVGGYYRVGFYCRDDKPIQVLSGYYANNDQTTEFNIRPNQCKGGITAVIEEVKTDQAQRFFHNNTPDNAPLAEGTPLRVKFEVPASSDSTYAEIKFDSTALRHSLILQDHPCEMFFYRFTNAGNETLVISSCQGSAGSVIPTCPNDPIPPGGSGIVKVCYGTNNPGPFTKTVTVHSNSRTGDVVLYLGGEVVAPEK